VYIKGEKLNKFCGGTEEDNDMVWQINSYKLRGNLIIWERKICYISLVAIYCNVQGSVAKSTVSIVELNINQDIYIYTRTSISRTVTVSLYTTVN